ncbi:MAG: hypothetical protein IPH76_05455 [Xanthomonadales bacterium]|nr:hypothetical protein [Xanthomonadales bacterium]
MSAMTNETTWARIGGASGTLAILGYLAAAFVPMPDVLTLTTAFAFGPLLAVGAVGLHRGIARWRGSALTQIAAGFAVAGGATVLIMLSVQQAIFVTLADLRGSAGSEPAVGMQGVEALGHAVHLGIDVAWDVLISTAVALFSAAMCRRGGWSRVMGLTGLALGLLLLGFNLWFFPEPPVSVESIDWGPFVALWLLAVFVALGSRRTWLTGD